MFGDLAKQFAGGNVNNLEGAALHGGVAQLLQGAQQQHGVSAISEALGAMRGGGMGNSVTHGAMHASAEQRNGLAGLLMNAVSSGGGSPQNVLSSLGIGGQNMNAQELGMLAEHVATNHPDALAGLLHGQAKGGSGGEMLSLLGNPMVRQIGMSLAKKII